MKATKLNRKIDMSPEAIDRRMRSLARLYEFGKNLKGARRLGKVKDSSRFAVGGSQSEARDPEPETHGPKSPTPDS